MVRPVGPYDLLFLLPAAMLRVRNVRVTVPTSVDVQGRFLNLSEPQSPDECEEEFERMC